MSRSGRVAPKKSPLDRNYSRFTHFGILLVYDGRVLTMFYRLIWPGVERRGSDVGPSIKL